MGRQRISAVSHRAAFILTLHNPRLGYIAAMSAEAPPSPIVRPPWQRALWVAAGALALATGIVGIFVPLLPTTPFVLLAAFCFSRGSARCERWIVEHPRFGPLVRDWRGQRAIPLRAKQLAWLMMAAGSALAAWRLPPAIAWLPAVLCAGVAWWMWRLPTRRPDGVVVGRDGQAL